MTQSSDDPRYYVRRMSGGAEVHDKQRDMSIAWCGDSYRYDVRKGLRTQIDGYAEATAICDALNRVGKQV